MPLGPRSRSGLLGVTLTIALAMVGCGSPRGSPQSATSAAGPTPQPGPSTSAGRTPVIVDTDLDLSDITALAILLRDPDVDVRAITISGTGLVHCPGGLSATHYVLEELGAPNVPFACGRETGVVGSRPFPADWRAVADAAYGLPISPQPDGDPGDAARLLADALDANPTATTIVALGPWTNIADALAADPAVAARIRAIHAMLGAIDPPGNVYVDGHDGTEPLEWNAYADPAAVTAVLAAEIPVRLIPLDATDDVPVPRDLVERLASDHESAGADLLYELLIRHPDRLLADQGQQLWDELAALTVTNPDLVTWDDVSLEAGDGGRLTRKPDGRAVRVATAANRPAVEAALLDALRRGDPRRTPFEDAGDLAVSWDGETCAIGGSAGARPGLYTLSLRNASGKPMAANVVGVAAPHTWADLTALLPTLIAGGGAPPDWVLVSSNGINDESGAGNPTPQHLILGPGVHGVVCLTGTWPDIDFHPGPPFAVTG